MRVLSRVAKFASEFDCSNAFNFQDVTFFMSILNFSKILDIKMWFFKIWKKKLATLLITNPVIWCCQITLKGCISLSFFCVFFHEFSKIRSTGGALHIFFSVAWTSVLVVKARSSNPIGTCFFVNWIFGFRIFVCLSACFYRLTSLRNFFESSIFF